ncbi:MAG: HesA/MoeB/ThiF family protein [Candidatus Aenigmatarchaeota archaeon]
MDNAELSDRELEFYSRQIVLDEIGYDGQLKLKNSKACIVGLGGLGSPAAYLLASIGVGTLRLVDYDVVELSNLHRQYLYDTGFLGFPKVEAAAKKLQKLNPNIVIEPIPLSLNNDTADEIIGGMDVVLDGLDSITSRYVLNRACQRLNVPYIYGAAIMTFGAVSTIIPGVTPCLECFYGNLKDDDLPKCAVVGVHPSILNIIASVEVSEAIQILLGKEPNLAGRLFYFDISNMNFSMVKILKSNNCPACGSNRSRLPLLTHKIVTEICARNRKRVYVIIPRKNLQIDMDSLCSILKDIKFDINVKAQLGITFSNGLIHVSILKSGIMIVEGMKSQKEAYDFYFDLIVDGLKFSPEILNEK